MAGNPAQNFFDLGFDFFAIAQILQLIHQIHDQGFCAHGAQNSRCFAHCYGASPKGLNDQPQFGQLLGALQKISACFSWKLNNIWNQKRLRGDAGFRHLCFQLFVNKAFMGCVLIHNHKAVFGLRNDVVLVNLASRCAQGKMILFSNWL